MSYSLQIKQQIAEAIDAYLADNNLSARKLADKAGVNASYLTAIKKGEFANYANGSPIPDNIFRALADAIGYRMEVFPTTNYTLIRGCCLEAKEQSEYRIIDGHRGAGKTFALTDLCRQFPIGTYYIRCSNSYTSKEFMRRLATVVGVSAEGTTTSIREAICAKLDKEVKPLIIVDEGENLKDSAYHALKDLHDEMEYRCGIVLVGANDYFASIKKRADRKKSCFPQIFSRFRIEPLILPDRIELADVQTIANTFGITEVKEVKRLHAEFGHDIRLLIRTLKKQKADQRWLTPFTTAAQAL